MSKKKPAHLENNCSNILPVTQRTTKDKTNTYFKKQQYKAKERNISKNSSKDGRNSLVQQCSS